MYYNNIRHKIVVFILMGFSAFYSLLGIYYLYYYHSVPIYLFVLLSLLLIFINSILNLAVPFSKIMEFFRKARFLQSKFIALYRKILLPLTFLLIFILLFLIFPGQNSISKTYLLFILISVILSQVISVIENIYNKSYGELFVLINILIMASVIGSSTPLIYKFNYDPSLLTHLTNILFYLLSLSFILFILLKDVLFGKKIAFISGIDLIIFVAITLFILSKSFIGFTKSEFLDPSLLIGFVVFMWYKVFVLFNEKYKRAVFHVSFILLDLALISLYLNFG